MSQHSYAVLALADGTVFRGVSIGAEGISTGEVVFNTSMTGYQEILTDPSYCRQIVTLTYPHVGNTGTNPDDMESGNIDRVYAAGLVIRDLPPPPATGANADLAPNISNNKELWRSQISIPASLHVSCGKRALKPVVIMAGARRSGSAEMAKEFPGLIGMDLAKVVSCAAAL